MAPSSSASKVAKLAQKGKGKKVRFQGGTIFPVVVAVVTLLGLGLIVYARESRFGPGQGSPTANDHWHAAFGIYACDDKGLQTLPKLVGNLEETDGSGQFVSTNFQRTGIHSHGDGVMHWHPSASGAATGTNAKLGVFLKNYDITLTDKKLVLPESQGGQTFEEGKSKCMVNGKEEPASLKLWVWPDFSTATTSEPEIYTANMDDVRLKNDGMVFMLAFAPDSVTPKPPEWTSQLPTLGAADGAGSSTSTTVAGTDAGLPANPTTTISVDVTTATTTPTTTATTTATTVAETTPETTPSSGG